MSLQDLEVLGYDPKELEKLRDEFNVSEESIKFHAVMVRLYGTDPRINPVSCPMRKEIHRNGKLPYVAHEATESFDVAKIIERHQVRIYEKQPERQEVLRNYIVPHSVASQGTSAISKHSPLYESLKKK